MKVLFLSHEATRTGAPLALMQEMQLVKKRCRDVSFELLLLAGGGLLDDFKKLCVVHRGWRDHTFTNRVLRQFCKQRIDKHYLYLFRKRQYDAIYANTIASFKAAVELKHKYDIPLIGHVHEAENAFVFYDLKKEQLDEFDKLIAVSQLTAQNLMDIYKVPSENIIIQHPMSYWIDNVMKEKRIVLPIKKFDEKFLIGIFCNGIWWKSTEIIPLVVKSFYKSHPHTDCEFVVVGNINFITISRLEYDLRKLNIQGKVHFVGAVENPLEWLARFDIFLLLSREESYSLVALEAAFVGTPIIGFEGVSGIADWMTDGAGSLVSYMDLDRVADEIYRYYSDDKLRKRTGIKAKEMALNLYKNDSRMSNILSLFTENE